MNMLERLVSMMVAAFNFNSLRKLVLDSAGGFARNLMSSFAHVGVEILGAIEVGLDRLDIQSAEGADLDSLADNFNLVRNAGTESEGYVNLWAFSLRSNQFIEAGTAVTTEDGTVFQTTRDAVIFLDPTDYPLADSLHPEFIGFDAAPDYNVDRRSFAVLVKEGVTYDFTLPSNEQCEATKDIPVSSTEIGRSQNVDAHDLSKGPSFLGGVNSRTATIETGVDNPLALSGGSDAETDDELRERILAHMRGTSTTTISALEAAALIPGIDDANILEPEDQKAGITPPPGSVYLIVASARRNYNPQMASEEAHLYEEKYPSSSPTTLKKKIRNKVESYRSVGVGVIVREAEIVQINFQSSEDSTGEMLIYVKSGSNLLGYTGVLEAKLRAFLESRKIGQTVYRSEIIAVIRSLDVVVDIGPFDLVADRWDYDNGVTLVRTGLAEIANTGRDSIVVNSEEIARPASVLRFRLLHERPE